MFNMKQFRSECLQKSANKTVASATLQIQGPHPVISDPECHFGSWWIPGTAVQDIRSFILLDALVTGHTSPPVHSLKPYSPLHECRTRAAFGDAPRA